MRTIGLGFIGERGARERGKTAGYGSDERWCRLLRLQEEVAHDVSTNRRTLPVDSAV